jgi:hypothetical protein
VVHPSSLALSTDLAIDPEIETWAPSSIWNLTTIPAI